MPLSRVQLSSSPPGRSDYLALALRSRSAQLALKCRLALFSALWAAPWKGLVGERRFWHALLSKAGSSVVVDAVLAKRARTQQALSRLARGTLSSVWHRSCGSANVVDSAGAIKRDETSALPPTLTVTRTDLFGGVGSAPWSAALRTHTIVSIKSGCTRTIFSAVWGHLHTSIQAWTTQHCHWATASNVYKLGL